MSPELRPCKIRVRAMVLVGFTLVFWGRRPAVPRQASVTGKGRFLEAWSAGFGASKLGNKLGMLWFLQVDMNLCWEWGKKMAPASSFISGEVFLPLQTML